jgi:hypothetical protein
VVDANLAIVALSFLGAGVLVSIPWGIAYAVRGWEAVAVRDRLRDERDRQRQRADRAERAAQAAADAARTYLAAVPVGAVGPADRERLLRALDESDRAVGAVDPGAPPAGAGRGDARVG